MAEVVAWLAVQTRERNQKQLIISENLGSYVSLEEGKDMAGWRRRRKTPRATRGVRGYTIRDRKGRITYVGISNNSHRRAREHSMGEKRGTLTVETPAMPRRTARQWEAGRLAAYRHNHDGKNPRHNKTRSGGWRF